MRRLISKYYDMVIQDTMEKLPGSTLQYDAILVDEGQDFSDAMLKIVMALLNPATNHLAIALDENQNIYQRRRSWKELGIQARGRVHRVTWVYRNTREIADFAAALFGNGASTPEAVDAAGHQGRLFPETFAAPHGAPPDIRAFSDYGKNCRLGGRKNTAACGRRRLSACGNRGSLRHEAPPRTTPS